MKIYTIIGGVNGVGKSSLSGVLAAESPDLGMIIDTDKITAEHGGDRIIGGKTAIERIDDCLEKGIDLTQETTLSGVRTLKTIKRARELDYYVRLYYIGISSAAESIARIGNRVRKGGHNIAAGDVERRFDKRFEDLARILPYCNEVRFYDNENGFADVGEYRNGTLILKGDHSPGWIKELKEYLKQ
ncbi:MAG: hypothetical protein K6C13_03945 [Oscillospiraceae bacterium]|nr:hypothetical protein [Oscillospiraceae bacterium]